MMIDVQGLHVQRLYKTGIQISIQNMLFVWFEDILTCLGHVQDQDYFA